MLIPQQEIETWVTALGHYDNNEFDEALRTFDAISDTSKILFNCGVIHATLGEHEKAVSSVWASQVRVDSDRGNRLSATSALYGWISTSQLHTSSRVCPTSSWATLRKH